MARAPATAAGGVRVCVVVRRSVDHCCSGRDPPAAAAANVCEGPICRSNAKESPRVPSGQAVRRRQNALGHVRQASRTAASIQSSERFQLNLLVLSGAARDDGWKTFRTVRPHLSDDGSLALLR